jgi:hypothetical protein
MMRGFNTCCLTHCFFPQNLNIYKETKGDFQLETRISTILSRILVGGVGVVTSVHGRTFSNLVHQSKFRVARKESTL